MRINNVAILDPLLDFIWVHSEDSVAFISYAVYVYCLIQNTAYNRHNYVELDLPDKGWSLWLNMVV